MPRPRSSRRSGPPSGRRCSEGPIAVLDDQRGVERDAPIARRRWIGRVCHRNKIVSNPLRHLIQINLRFKVSPKAIRWRRRRVHHEPLRSSLPPVNIAAALRSHPSTVHRRPTACPPAGTVVRRSRATVRVPRCPPIAACVVPSAGSASCRRHGRFDALADWRAAKLKGAPVCAARTGAGSPQPVRIARQEIRRELLVGKVTRRTVVNERLQLGLRERACAHLRRIQCRAEAYPRHRRQHHDRSAMPSSEKSARIRLARASGALSNNAGCFASNRSTA